MSRSDNSSKYNKLHTVVVSVRLNKKTDSDIINRLKAQQSRQGYIKRLIREDMKRELDKAFADILRERGY